MDLAAAFLGTIAYTTDNIRHPLPSPIIYWRSSEDTWEFLNDISALLQGRRRFRPMTTSEVPSLRARACPFLQCHRHSTSKETHLTSQTVAPDPECTTSKRGPSSDAATLTLTTSPTALNFSLETCPEREAHSRQFRQQAKGHSYKRRPEQRGSCRLLEGNKKKGWQANTP